MKRLFFALWPNDKTRDECVKIIRSIDSGNASPVKPENLHVTLLFLGNLTSEQEATFCQIATNITVPTISLCFDGLSFWKNPAILCLTATEFGVELKTLVEQLASTAKALSIPFEDRPYQPHVTLFRKAKVLTALEFKPIEWQSNSFCLVESRASPKGIEYKLIEQWCQNKASAQHY